MRRRLLWLLTPALVIMAYWLLRTYADESRAIEAVMGLSHGSPVANSVVALGVLVLRVLAYAVTGGVLVAWPVDELLRSRRGEQPDTLSLLTRER